MESYKYVIVGGGLAAARTAFGIRKGDEKGSVLVVCGEPHPPYERPPLSKEYLRREKGLDKVYYKPDSWYADNNIQVVSGVRASRVNPSDRLVTLEDGTELQYEKLMLATGGRARRLSLPGSDLKGVHTLRTIENSNALHDEGAGKRVLVLGGSFIGSEVTASLTQLGAKVTMVFPGMRLQERIVPREVSEFLQDLFTRNGIRIITGTKASSFRGDGRVQQAELENGETLDVDMVVMGVGIELNVELAKDAGLEMTDEGAVKVDEQLRTSDLNIYAAGDIASWPDATFGKRLRVEHWDVARDTGRRAGQNMAGESDPYTELPYFFSDLFQWSPEMWGDFSAWDDALIRGSVEDNAFTVYYFGQGKLTGVMIAGRLKDQRNQIKALVKSRPDYDEVVKRLKDENAYLASFAL